MKIMELKKAELNPNPHHVKAKKLYDTENALVVGNPPKFYDATQNM